MIGAWLAVWAVQTPWLQAWGIVVVILAGLVWGLVTWVLVALVREEWGRWRATRRRQREITDGAVRYLEQRQRHQQVRRVVDDERGNYILNSRRESGSVKEI